VILIPAFSHSLLAWDVNDIWLQEGRRPDSYQPEATAPEDDGTGLQPFFPFSIRFNPGALPQAGMERAFGAFVPGLVIPIPAFCAFVPGFVILIRAFFAFVHGIAILIPLFALSLLAWMRTISGSRRAEGPIHTSLGQRSLKMMERACSPSSLFSIRYNPGALPQAGMERAFGAFVHGLVILIPAFCAFVPGFVILIPAFAHSLLAWMRTISGCRRAEGPIHASLGQRP